MTLSLEWSVEASYTPIQPPQQSELSISPKCPICRTSTMAMGLGCARHRGGVVDCCGRYERYGGGLGKPEGSGFSDAVFQDSA